MEKLIQKELESANKTYDPHFHSAHEGYAIILEEFEEMDTEMSFADTSLSMVWDKIKAAPYEHRMGDMLWWAEKACEEVQNGIVEAIQTAAMLKKFINSAPHWSGKE